MKLLYFSIDIQGLSQKFLDKLKVKKTENVFDKVDLFYSKQSPLDSIHRFAWVINGLKDIFISSVKIMFRIVVVGLLMSSMSA